MRYEFDSRIPHITFHMKQNLQKNIPGDVLNIVKSLQNKGFEAQIVGGSIRDLLLGLDPKDWDINTNAKPEEILAIFSDSFYENEFGTVGVKIRKNVTHETVNIEETEIVEVTPYRKEGIYKDGRHPENVSFDATLEDDLKRRDFTVNALAYDPIKDTLNFLNSKNSLEIYSFSDRNIDIKDIIKDIFDKRIKAVGNPKDRFQEDYLRMLRAVRLANQLGFTIEKKDRNSYYRICK